MRTLTTLVATAALMWGAPSLAADGLLIINGKTLLIYDISGGDLYADTKTDKGNTTLGMTRVKPVRFRVDARAFNDLMPQINDLLTGQISANNAVLASGAYTYDLFGVSITGIGLPACDGQMAASQYADIELYVETAKQKPDIATLGLMDRRPKNVSFTSCTLIAGAGAAPEALTRPINIGINLEEVIGELRDYDKESPLLRVSPVTLKGKALSAWGRASLSNGEDVATTAKVTYATGIGPSLVVTYTQAKPAAVSPFSDETTLTSANVTLTKP